MVTMNGGPFIVISNKHLAETPGVSALFMSALISRTV